MRKLKKYENDFEYEFILKGKWVAHFTGVCIINLFTFLSFAFISTNQMKQFHFWLFFLHSDWCDVICKWGLTLKAEDLELLFIVCLVIAENAKIQEGFETNYEWKCLPISFRERKKNTNTKEWGCDLYALEKNFNLHWEFSFRYFSRLVCT